MALVTCRECQKQVSDQAAACPGCGAPVRTPPVVFGSPAPAAPTASDAKKKTSGCAAVLVLGAVVWIWNTISGGSTKAPPYATPAPVAAPTLAENPSGRVKLETFDWYTGGFGAVMLLQKATIRNGNAYAVKDVTVECSLFAKSGTSVGRVRHTILDVIKPGEKKTFKEVNMGFVDQQAASCACNVTDAKRSTP